jgi:hypothetical protein
MDRRDDALWSSLMSIFHSIAHCIGLTDHTSKTTSQISFFYQYSQLFIIFIIYSNEPTHDILKQALTACTCMEHRGASSADNISGDGAGIVHIMILRPIFIQINVAYIICPFVYKYIEEHL